MPGSVRDARVVSQVIEMPQCGSVPQVGGRRLAERNRCKAVAGSFACVQRHGRARVVPDADATTKAATGFYFSRLDDVPAGAEQALLVIVPGRLSGERATWLGEIRSGERMSSGNEAAMKMVMHECMAVLSEGFN